WRRMGLLLFLEGERLALDAAGALQCIRAMRSRGAAQVNRLTTGAETERKVQASNGAVLTHCPLFPGNPTHHAQLPRFPPGDVRLRGQGPSSGQAQRTRGSSRRL